MNEINITLKKVNSVSDPLFAQICNLLEESFISDELRDYNADLLANEKFNLCAIFYSNAFIGMKAWWNFENFIYTEHIAVVKDFRNKGIGGALFETFFKTNPCDLYILETERAVTDIARRRMGFYERLGYKINSTFDYIQPPYSKEKSPVPMYLVSYPVQLTPDEYEKIKTTMHSEVYEFA